MSNPDLAHQWAYTFLNQLKSLGVERVFVAPGSRSTVLTLQAFNLFGERTLTHFDERGLGFAALGAAKASRSPTCIITTSGTAVANLLPAVIEARYSHAPLIILSADRPPEMQRRGCNQTIDQREIFGPHALAYHEILPADEVTPLTQVQEWALSAWSAVTEPGNEGAVQVNWMFREPFLIGEAAEAAVPLNTPPPRTLPERVPHRADLASLEAIINHTTRGVCIVGALETPADAIAVKNFIHKLGWITLVDSLSQLRQESENERLLTYGDMSLLAPLSSELQPDTILHLGGRLVSKRISALLAPHLSSSPSVRVVSVTPSKDYFNPNHGIRQQIVTPLQALNDLALSPSCPTDPSFQATLINRNATIRGVFDAFFEERMSDDAALTEPAIIRALSLHTPSAHTLMLGNSMPIRDFEFFAAPQRAAPRVIANRGASGIDGVLATACGAAMGSQAPVTLVIGDLSTLHDINSLALSRQVKTPLPIIVINNDGGGIFSLLPVSKTEHFEPLFGTPHGLHFREIASGFGLPYASPSTMGDLLRAYQSAASRPGASIIELTTDRQSNADLHRSISAMVSKSISSSGM